MNIDDDDPLAELHEEKPVAELPPEQLIFYRAYQVAAALDLPLAAIRDAVAKKRIRPAGFLVIDESRFEELFELGSFPRIKRLLGRSED
jgi:hypothetical protein